jgi:hypothetical protein
VLLLAEIDSAAEDQGGDVGIGQGKAVCLVVDEEHPAIGEPKRVPCFAVELRIEGDDGAEDGGMVI